MNKTIREASTFLTGLLPPDSNYYSIDDLHRLGMHDFIVRRIKMEVADRLSKSMVIPSTEWLDTSRSIVTASWTQFMESIKAEAHLPRKYAADIIDNAVIETVELIIAPRRRVIEWLFGPQNEVSIGVVRQRSQYITVNRYLVEALVRYMERKDLAVITKPAAVDVIKTVDDRYISGYTPLNWAQLIDPLFQIARNRVDSDLIHDFFVDKGREDLAALFPETAIIIERVQFIERLSVGRVTRRQEQEQEQEQEQAYSEPVEAAIEEKVPTVHQQQHLLAAETGDDHPSASIIPIWQRFLSDVPDNVVDDEPESGYEPDNAEPFAEKFSNQDLQPAATTPSLHSVGFQKAKLVDWLKNDENTYIEELFNGNEMAYYRTIAQLESYSDWERVQSLLKDWIRSAEIDLESVELAHLVDQLQIYFTTNDS